MMTNILYFAFLTLFAVFIGWRKHKRRKSPQKQWTGQNPDAPSTEVMRQDQNKYRGFAQIG